MNNNTRRAFLRNLTLAGTAATAGPSLLFASSKGKEGPTGQTIAQPSENPETNKRAFNAPYEGDHLNRIAFPIGGIGAGMFCLEGTGAISHMSVRHNPEIFNEPTIFAAISTVGKVGSAKIVEGAVPDWKKFGGKETGLGGIVGNTWGLPRFKNVSFDAKFPFANVILNDEDFPLEASIEGWSPFIPTDADSASLPIGALEYTFKHVGKEMAEFVFSYNARNFMIQQETKNYIKGISNGFVLAADATVDAPEKQGQFAIFTDHQAMVDHCWFRGGWFDPLTMIWNTIDTGDVRQQEPVEKDAPGASLFVRFKLKPGEKKKITLFFAWYVPDTKLRIGEENRSSTEKESAQKYYKPWYSQAYKNVEEIATYWLQHYDQLKHATALFKDTFYKSTLPPEVIEAVAANLTILKSPTVMRQYDGRFWTWEGCGDSWGSCHGSCTHVWNYAQAVPHLFPELERSLRQTEFHENQNEDGHQSFRANIPISPTVHDFHAAADGQLGGIMKVYRDWRISGDDSWLKDIYPLVKKSMDYCIRTWDPDGKGVLQEPHHNTYDIEFWGPDGMCTSFYLGALVAIQEMGNHLKENVAGYQELYKKGQAYMETDLFDGEYFIQEIKYEGLRAPDPAKVQSFGGDYSPEAQQLLVKEGPKYQYGKGCLSDGVLGAWIARVCGLQDPMDKQKIKSHLEAVHRYNLKQNLMAHANPQRSTFAFGKDSGLLLCSWPNGGMLSLPFVYSNEVWTGIEYQVASHLMFMGEVEKGLDIVRACRLRYDGTVRNPFNEYECGHWYARAMASYACIAALTGVRYDAVDKTLYIDSKIGDFTSFLSTNKGFGTVNFSRGQPKLEVVYGEISVEKVIVSGEESKLV